MQRLKPARIRLAHLRFIHRYAGLGMAVFLILVGVTGSLLAFYPELEQLTAPQFYTSSRTDAPLDIGVLGEKATHIDPQCIVTSVSLSEPGRAVVGVAPRINPETQLPFALTYSQMLLNPYTGELLGTRHQGAISEGWHNLLPFIYEFHYSLILGDTGIWILGIVAFIWVVDCFTGLIITFPARGRHQQSAPSFWARWKKAWVIKWGASKWRLNFDLHRALSLWLWGALLVFAWTSVYMNLWDTAYTHITRALMPFHPPWYELAGREPAPAIPQQDWRTINAKARALMNEQAKQIGFTLERPSELRYEAHYNAYRYRVLSSLDLSDRFARTEVFFDATNGELLLNYFPSGQHTGNTVSLWLHALHTGRVWGLPYRIFVCVLGVFIVVITLTGVLVWWNKRHALRRHLSNL
ncbi:MAG: hypothetical protein RL497_1365 [Pseudomonadota bacterium]|jgi:uncharacterized iron-regulated membrane protein